MSDQLSDHPREVNGEPVKYETPRGSRMVLYAFVGTDLLHDPSKPLWIIKGIKKVDSAISNGLVCVGLHGVSGFRGRNLSGETAPLAEWDDIALKERLVYIAFDSDVVEKEVQLAMDALCKFLASRGADVQCIFIPSINGQKTGLDDWFASGRTVEELMGHARPFLDPPEANDRKSSQVAESLRIVFEAGLKVFKNEQGDPFCSYPRGKGIESVSIASAKGFVVGAIQKAQGQIPATAVLREVLEQLDIRARYGDVVFPVASRVYAQRIVAYLYLADHDRTVIEIDRDGWRPVIDPAALQVRFVATKSAKALPVPVRGPAPCDLSKFLNVPPEELCLAWGLLVGCFLPAGTMAVLIAQGEQGSGKTFGATQIRNILDPVTVPLAPLVPDSRALRARISSGFIVGYDNVSKLRGEFSDLLCSVASGTGFADRALYSDADEHTITARRPIILNGISDFVSRADLLDRSITLNFRRLDVNARRKEERDLIGEFTKDHPAILAELLDRVSRSCRDQSIIDLAGESARLIDLMRWVEASEPPHQRGEFRRAYLASRREQNEVAAETDLLIQRILKLMENHESLRMSTSELFGALNVQDFPGGRAPESWPRAPGALTQRLKRDIPMIRSVGLDVEQVRDSQSRGWRLSRVTQSSDGVTVTSSDTVTGGGGL